MRIRFRLGKSGKIGRLAPEQEEVLKRLEAGEISDEEATEALGGRVRTWRWLFGTDDDAPATPRSGPAEPAEDEAAKALVERIAREVDAES